MPLWILKRRTKVDYDETREVLVRAPTAAKARELATTAAQTEGKATWTNPDLTSCEVLTARGKAEVIMSDTLDG